MMYKGIQVSKKSALAEALDAGKQKDAQKIYEATTLAFEALYGIECAAWFYKKSKETL